MKLVEWVKWRVAPREMEELERWRIQWEEHRRWFAEFPIAAVTLDHLKAKVEREPVTSIHVVRDSCRSADAKVQDWQAYTAPPQRKPLTGEQDRALCEAYCNDASDEYFKARPAMDFPEMRRIFYAGHRKAWINYEAAHGIKEGT